MLLLLVQVLGVAAVIVGAWLIAPGLALLLSGLLAVVGAEVYGGRA